MMQLCLIITAQNSLNSIGSIKLSEEEFDPCYLNPEIAEEDLQRLGPGWGYNYDSLLVDFDKWEESPFVTIDSAGASVQNRTLWLLTITDTLEKIEPRIRIMIHVRTHPNEVQSFYVTEKMIEILSADSALSKKLKHNCIFSIMPMYNPDGVELGYARENANHIDLERNWDTDDPEPEVETLKGLFIDYIFSDSPIRIALNMHGDGGASKRYFVYHHENGTSVNYAEKEREFISGIHSYWPEGISDWDAVVTWTTGTPTYYPESWWWRNNGSSVMALTHEEVAVESEEDLYRSANAILNGIADYLKLDEITNIEYADLNTNNPKEFALIKFYPNPISQSSSGNIDLTLSNKTTLQITLYDILGREINEITTGFFGEGNHQFSFTMPKLPSGTYYLRLNSKLGVKSIPITVIH